MAVLGVQMMMLREQVAEQRDITLHRRRHQVRKQAQPEMRAALRRRRGPDDAEHHQAAGGQLLDEGHRAVEQLPGDNVYKCQNKHRQQQCRAEMIFYFIQNFLHLYAPS